MKHCRLLFVYVLLLVLALLTMAILWFSLNQKVLPRDYTEIREEGILRMITEYSQSGYYIAGDTIEGFQYELSRAIALVSGLEVQTQLEMNLPESFRSLVQNKSDIIARNIPVTSDLNDTYLFTDPIVFNKQVLVQRTADANKGIQPIRNQINLANKTIYIPQNSPAILRLRHLADEIGDSIEIVEEALYSSEQLLIMVAKGDIDYAVCDQQVAQRLTNELPEIDTNTDISFTQLQAWAVRKDSPVLRDSLNSWIKQIKENGLYNKIYKRYYNQQ